MSRPPAPRVLFIHGLESSPRSPKALYLAERFEALTPAMDTGDPEGCLAQQERALSRFDPHVVVGSSFGGGLALSLLQRGAWRGPTLLLAPAAARMGLPHELPEGVPVILVHGTRDDVIPLEDSRRLARTGSPELVRLEEVDDGHQLASSIESGRLGELVEELASA